MGVEQGQSSLAPNDALRLHVLLNEEPKAIRIDESSLTLHAFTRKGEASIQLHPNDRNDRYLKRVRERLSEYALGSPHGYPVFMQRWTRMGQTRDQNLAKLLLLGEPEAVSAVVHAPGLTASLAELAWWAAPNADHARAMLAQPEIAYSGTGASMRNFLREFLPFEQNSLAVIQSVAAIITDPSLNDDERDGLWRKGQQNSAYLAGFLTARSWVFPDAKAHPALDILEPTPEENGRGVDSWLIKGLRASWSAEGQYRLATLARALKSARDQEVVISLIDSHETWTRVFRPTHPAVRTSAGLEEKIHQQLNSHGAFSNSGWASINSMPTSRGHHMSRRDRRAYVGNHFYQTDAVGSVMRKRLTPLVEPLDKAIDLTEKSHALHVREVNAIQASLALVCALMIITDVQAKSSFKNAQVDALLTKDEVPQGLVFELISGDPKTCSGLADAGRFSRKAARKIRRLRYRRRVPRGRAIPADDLAQTRAASRHRPTRRFG